MLAWNKAAEEVFAFGRMADEDRNTSDLHADQAGKAAACSAESWADEAQADGAMFRMTHDLWAGDPAFVDLLDRLRRDSPEFAGWWKAHDIRDVAAGQKQMSIRRRACCASSTRRFQCNDEPGLKLVIYTPVYAAGARLSGGACALASPGAMLAPAS